MKNVYGSFDLLNDKLHILCDWNFTHICRSSALLQNWHTRRRTSETPQAHQLHNPEHVAQWKRGISHRFEGERNWLITTHMPGSSRNRRRHETWAINLAKDQKISRMIMHYWDVIQLLLYDTKRAFLRELWLKSGLLSPKKLTHNRLTCSDV